MSLLPGIPIIFHVFVERELLTQITERTVSSSLFNLSEGYTPTNPLGVRIWPKKVRYGSWISIMSHVFLSDPFMRSRCAFSDLFKLSCRILSLFGGESLFSFILERGAVDVDSKVFFASYS